MKYEPQIKKLVEFYQAESNFKFVSIHLDKEESIIYAGSGSGNIHLINATDGSPIISFKAHYEQVYSLLIRGRTLITSSIDGSIKIWDLRDY